MGHAPLHAQRIADREHHVPHPQVVAVVDHDRLRQPPVGLRGIELEEREIPQRLERQDLHLAKLHFLEAAPGPGRSSDATKHRGPQLRVVLDHVVVGHEVAFPARQEAGAQPAGIADHHDGLAEPLDELGHLAGLEPAGAEDAPLGRMVGRGDLILPPHVEHPLGGDLEHLVAEIEHQSLVGPPQQRGGHLAAPDEGHRDDLAGRTGSGCQDDHPGRQRGREGFHGFSSPARSLES